jgi:hypothetical protein
MGTCGHNGFPVENDPLWKALWITQSETVDYAPETSTLTEAVTSGCSRIWTR